MENTKQTSRKMIFQEDGKQETSKQTDEFLIRWKRRNKQAERQIFNWVESTKQANRKIDFKLGGKGQASKKTDKFSS